MSVGDGFAHSMVSLSSIQSFVHVAPKERRVDVVKEIETADDVLKFPQRLLGAILAPVTAEL